MDEKNINKNDEIEIDISRLISALINKAWLVGIASVLCAVIALIGTLLLATPLYESSAMFYVTNSSVSQGEASLTISSADISASRGLAQSCIVILNTGETLNEVIDYAGVDCSFDQAKKMISAALVDNTEIFSVVVTGPDPQETEKIANAIVHILPKRLSSIIEGASAKIVDFAAVPSSPSSPNKTKIAVIGLMLGMVMSGGWVILRELMDTTIHTEEDIVQNCNYPVLASVPAMACYSKGGSYCGYGKKRACKKTDPKKDKKPVLVGPDISFLAAESYKILRTKLQFSFGKEGGCHVIGISSAMAGEGKSLSAVNLAYSISQLGRRVLLIDCDMRRSSLADIISVDKCPGLSDFLTGQANPEDLLQHCGIENDEKAFHVISSGHTPPNPMELLNSGRMERMLACLRQKYDDIILDLPPVGEVGDAMAATKLTDGMLLVVRQGYCNRIALNSAVRQFEFVDTKLLGVVYNCTAEERTGFRSGYCRKQENSHQSV